MIFGPSPSEGIVRLDMIDNAGSASVVLLQLLVQTRLI